MRLVIFGVSNLLGAIMDCALELKLTPSLVVMNVPEVLRPRTRSVNDRLRLFPAPPKIIDLENFTPQQGECYFLGTTSPSRRQLVEHIRSRFGITCCTLVHPMAYVSPRASLAATSSDRGFKSLWSADFIALPSLQGLIPFFAATFLNHCESCAVESQSSLL